MSSSSYLRRRTSRQDCWRAVPVWSIVRCPLGKPTTSKQPYKFRHMTQDILYVFLFILLAIWKTFSVLLAQSPFKAYNLIFFCNNMITADYFAWKKCQEAGIIYSGPSYKYPWRCIKKIIMKYPKHLTELKNLAPSQKVGSL